MMVVHYQKDKMLSYTHDMLAGSLLSNFPRESSHLETYRDQDVASKALAMANTLPSVPDAPITVTPNGNGFAGVSS
jgi:hypothetical protein